MSEITAAQAAATMQQYGGNGMKKMADCWGAFDPERRARLEAAFKPEFDHYRAMCAEDANQADLRSRN